jgi:hypothetical protein
MAGDSDRDRVATMVGLFNAWLDVVPTEWNLYRLGTGSEEFKQWEATAEALAQQMRDLQDTSETTGGTSG